MQVHFSFVTFHFDGQVHDRFIDLFFQETIQVFASKRASLPVPSEDTSGSPCIGNKRFKSCVQLNIFG